MRCGFSERFPRGRDAWGDFVRPLLILLGYTLAAFVGAVLIFRKKMKQ